MTLSGGRPVTTVQERISLKHEALLNDLRILMKVILINSIVWSIIGTGTGVYWIGIGIYKYFTGH